MQFPQEPTDTILKSSSKKLRATSAVKPPFDVDNGLFEVFKSRRTEKYYFQMSNSEKKRRFNLENPSNFKARDKQFSFQAPSKNSNTFFSGILNNAEDVLKLQSLIQSMSKHRGQWKSKEQLIPQKENSVKSATGNSLMKENILTPKGASKITPKRQGMKPQMSLSNPVFARAPLQILPQSCPSTPMNDDVKITAIAGKNATPSTSAFYGKSNVAKMMSQPRPGMGTPGKQSASSFPPFKPTQRFRWSKHPRFKYEKEDENTSISTDRVVGFANLGNTCYMNAILQCLLNIPNFFQELRNESNIGIVHHDSLYNRLCNLGHIKHNHEGADIQRNVLQKVKQSISEAAKRFSGYAQHDAHEFLCQCLDQLKEDLSNELTKRKDDFQLSENELSSIFTCPIKENFETTVVHSIKCLGCNEEVVKKEDYHDFSLVIPEVDENVNIGDLTITNLLKLYFSDECIEYTCEKCNGDQSVLSHKFQKLPRVLVLHIKRYDMYDTKRSDEIIIPKVLNVSRQISTDTICPKKFEFEKSLWENKNSNQPGSKRKLSSEVEGTPCTKAPKKSYLSISSEKELHRKAGEMIAIAHRDSVRDEEIRKKCVSESTPSSEFTKIKGPRKSLFSENSTAICDSPVKEKSILDNLTTVSDDEEEALKKALELSMQEYEHQQKIDMLLYAEKKSESSDDSVSHGLLSNKSNPFLNTSLFDTEVEIDYGKKQLYHLVGIVNHHGLNTASGHYTCDCYDFKSKEWRNYNDSSVKEIKEEELFSARKQSAYIVFYMHSSCFDAIESKS